MTQKSKLLLSARTGVQPDLSRRSAMKLMAAGTTLLAAPFVHTRSSRAAGKVTLATWPNYHNMDNIAAFTQQTGIDVAVATFGSNEEMMAKMQAGDSGFDVVVPSNYAIEPYARLGLIQPLDRSKLPNFDASSVDPRFVDVATINGNLYAIHKNWGTTGFVYNASRVTEAPTSMKEFFELAAGKYSGSSMALDHQLSTVGSALVSLGHSFNAVDPAALKQVEEMLINLKPHLFSITSSPQPPLRSEDAVLALCWNFDAGQMTKDMPEIKYVVAKDGGEVWSDFYAVVKESQNPEAAYALINYLIEPNVNVKEFAVTHAPIADSRVTKLLPPEVLQDPTLYPSADLLAKLEFGSAEAFSSPARNDILAHFKAA
jgi:spermidine/putrescine transport system substrate-binding protein